MRAGHGGQYGEVLGMLELNTIISNVSVAVNLLFFACACLDAMHVQPQLRHHSGLLFRTSPNTPSPEFYTLFSVIFPPTLVLYINPLSLCSHARATYRSNCSP